MPIAPNARTATRRPDADCIRNLVGGPGFEPGALTVPNSEPSRPGVPEKIDFRSKLLSQPSVPSRFVTFFQRITTGNTTWRRLQQGPLARPPNDRDIARKVI